MSIADRHTAVRRAGAHAMRLTAADVERIADKADVWALVARLDAVRPRACAHVRADWREQSPDRAGDV